MQAPKKTAPVRESLRAKAASAVEPQPPAAVDRHAVDEGRKPLASRRKDLAALRSKAKDLYGIPADGLAAIPAIESKFHFTPLESDAEFQYLHVEALLDQAAALLERCAAARAERDRLQLEKWKLAVELDRFLRLDQVGERERQAGLDTLPYERATAESAAENSLETNHKNAEAQLKGLTDDLLASGFNKRMAAHELSAWISAYPLKDTDLRGDDASYVFDGARKTKPEHLFDAARMDADEAAWELFAGLMAQRFATMAASEAGRLHKESLDLQAKWALANIAFRTEKAQAERDAVWEKVYQAQVPGGLFHYEERIAQMERQFALDFREALARLTPARRGLSELYGYAPPFPQEATAGYFDEVSGWVRGAKNRTAQFSQLDQTYVLAVSVKELAKSQWEAGRSSSQWTFEVPEDLFRGQANVRLRGLGLAVVGEPAGADAGPQKAKGASKADVAPAKPAGFWSARLTVPPTAAVRHLSGETKELDQKTLPPCYFGRVADRDSPREPEMAGTALHNASPVGKEWKLTLSPKSTDGTPTASLQDVQLYLQVAVR